MITLWWNAIDNRSNELFRAAKILYHIHLFDILIVWLLTINQPTLMQQLIITTSEWASGDQEWILPHINFRHQGCFFGFRPHFKRRNILSENGIRIDLDNSISHYGSRATNNQHCIVFSLFFAFLWCCASLVRTPLADRGSNPVAELSCFIALASDSMCEWIFFSLSRTPSLFFCSTVAIRHIAVRGLELFIACTRDLCRFVNEWR